MSSGDTNHTSGAEQQQPQAMVYYPPSYPHPQHPHAPAAHHPQMQYASGHGYAMPNGGGQPVMYGHHPHPPYYHFQQHHYPTPAMAGHHPQQQPQQQPQQTPSPHHPNYYVMPHPAAQPVFYPPPHHQPQQRETNSATTVEEKPKQSPRVRPMTAKSSSDVPSPRPEQALSNGFQTEKTIKQEEKDQQEVEEASPPPAATAGQPPPPYVTNMPYGGQPMMMMPAPYYGAPPAATPPTTTAASNQHQFAQQQQQPMYMMMPQAAPMMVQQGQAGQPQMIMVPTPQPQQAQPQQPFMMVQNANGQMFMVPQQQQQQPVMMMAVPQQQPHQIVMEQPQQKQPTPTRTHHENDDDEVEEVPPPKAETPVEAASEGSSCPKAEVVQQPAPEPKQEPNSPPPKEASDSPTPPRTKERQETEEPPQNMMVPIMMPSMPDAKNAQEQPMMLVPMPMPPPASARSAEQPPQTQAPMMMMMPAGGMMAYPAWSAEPPADSEDKPQASAKKTTNKSEAPETAHAAHIAGAPPPYKTENATAPPNSLPPTPASDSVIDLTTPPVAAVAPPTQATTTTITTTSTTSKKQPQARTPIPPRVVLNNLGKPHDSTSVSIPIVYEHGNRKMIPANIASRNHGKTGTATSGGSRSTKQMDGDGAVDFSHYSLAELQTMAERRGMSDKRPKRPVSAYNLFFRDERAKIVAADTTSDGDRDEYFHTTRQAKRSRRQQPHFKVSFTELGKEIARRWKKLDAAGLKHYVDQSDLCRQKHREDIALWHECLNRGIFTRQPKKPKLAVGAAAHLPPPVSSAVDLERQERLSQVVLATYGTTMIFHPSSSSLVGQVVVGKNNDENDKMSVVEKGGLDSSSSSSDHQHNEAVVEGISKGSSVHKIPPE